MMYRFSPEESYSWSKGSRLTTHASSTFDVSGTDTNVIWLGIFVYILVGSFLVHVLTFCVMKRETRGSEEEGQHVLLKKQPDLLSNV